MNYSSQILAENLVALLYLSISKLNKNQLRLHWNLFTTMRLNTSIQYFKRKHSKQSNWLILPEIARWIGFHWPIFESPHSTTFHTRVSRDSKRIGLIHLQNNARWYGVHSNVTRYSPFIHRFSAKKKKESSLGVVFSYSWHKANWVNSAVVYSYLSTNWSVA